MLNEETLNSIPHEKKDAIKNYLKEEFEKFNDVVENYDFDHLAYVIAFTPTDKDQRIRVTIQDVFLQDHDASKITDYLSKYRIAQELAKQKKITLPDSHISFEYV